MELKSIRIRNFKCVDDTDEFSIDDVTCLVGKNESGKTTVLQALHRLNPAQLKEDPSAKLGMYDLTNDYPRRHLADYDERHPDESAVVIETAWQLAPEERSHLESLFGPSCVSSDTIRISKNYDNEILIDASPSESTVIQHWISNSDLHTEEKEAANAATTIASLKQLYQQKGDKLSDREKKLLQDVEKQFKQADARTALRDEVKKLMPKFLYFSQYDRMLGNIPVDDFLRRRKESKLENDDRVALAFVSLAKTTLEDIQKLNQFEQVTAQFEAVSIKISREIFDYWSQNKHLAVKVLCGPGLPGDPAPLNQGTVVRIRIENTHHQVTVPFNDRSTGFVWFFSFLVLFSQLKQEHGSRLIILLDEPGLSLHAKAQHDLLRYIDERLAPSYQVIYTSHSPFMVPTDHLDRVRTVEDVVQVDRQGCSTLLGTRVGDRVLSTDKETLFPIQGALGYEISQALFVGKHTLAVEGPSDLLFLKTFSSQLQRSGRNFLDPRWTICPVGGIPKLESFVNLFAGNHLHVAALADYATGDKRKIESLRQNPSLGSSHLFTADAYAGQSEADTEDMIGAESYVALVNRAYSLTAPHALSQAKLPTSSVRVAKQVEECFNLLPPHIPTFDHFVPAAYLAENQGSLFSALTSLGPALDRFERFFVEVNALLPS